MDFKYVPVIKNRSAERTAIINQSYSDKVLPLIEMVIDKPTVNSNYNYFDKHEEFFDNIKSRALVDIPMNIPITIKTIDNVKSFLTPIYNAPITRTKWLSKLRTPENKFIPVISYSPNTQYANSFLKSQEKILRKNFQQLAFRLYLPHLIEAVNEVSNILQDNDIILLDIEKSYNLTEIKLIALYDLINSFKKIKKVKTVLIHRAISDDFSKSSIIDGQVINKISTSLLSNFSILNFDAFGDYCGIKNLPLEEIPVSYPAYLYYSGTKNNYIGFKGEFKKPRTFTTKVLPKYTNSSYWQNINTLHMNNCYGCKKILDMKNGLAKINSATTWKTITTAHYIQAVDEIL